MSNFNVLIESVEDECRRWCRKKRPATVEFRAELLQIATEQRAEEHRRLDGKPLTPEDRRHIKQAQREAYRAGRAFVLEAEKQIEIKFWQLLADFGIYPGGNLQ